MWLATSGERVLDTICYSIALESCFSFFLYYPLLSDLSKHRWLRSGFSALFRLSKHGSFAFLKISVLFITSLHPA